MRPAGAYHDSVPSVLHQQHARGQTRCSGTQTSKNDGATFVYVIRTCMRERHQHSSPAPAQAESTETICHARQRVARRSLRGQMVMQQRSGCVAVHHQLTTTAGGSVVSDGLKAHGRDAGDASADKHDGGFSRHRSPRRPFGSRGFGERSRDAVCRRASVSARSCDMRAKRVYHTTVPSVLRQQDARVRTRWMTTQTSQHDGATFAASCGCGREPTNKRAPASA